MHTILCLGMNGRAKQWDISKGEGHQMAGEERGAAKKKLRRWSNNVNLDMKSN